mgnify:CR=1 FL=1
MRDFFYDDALWCVVKDDGKFAGIPCLTYEEALELSNQHENSAIFKMNLEFINSKGYNELK